MSYLNREEIINEVKDIKNGRIIRIGYRTELPMKAAEKDKGITIEKITETTVRVGVRYSSIAGVKEVLAKKEPKKCTNNYVWIVKNKVKHNTNTGKDYLQVATFNKGHNTKTAYIVRSPLFTVLFTPEQFEKTYYKNMIRESYFNKSGNTDIMTISLDNLYKVNNLCCEPAILSVVEG